MKRNWSDDELQEFWSLSPDELGLLPSKSAARRLGFALQLKFLQIQGQFPEYRRELPALAIRFVAPEFDTFPASFVRRDASLARPFNDLAAPTGHFMELACSGTRSDLSP